MALGSETVSVDEFCDGLANRHLGSWRSLCEIVSCQYQPWALQGFPGWAVDGLCGDEHVAS
jgi:hypothetical protein